MCVIILRNPGIVLPFDKLETACHVNDDGWGLAIADRGKIELELGLENDPDTIAKRLEDAKDLPILLHLRYITVGEKRVENCHPFRILTAAEHGADIVLAHNGTLINYKTPADGASDSKHFADQFVKPLFERVIKFTGPTDLLKDEFTRQLLKNEVGSSSVVTLFDGNGVSHTVNPQHGAEFPGWWASNTYSFKATHREPVSTGVAYGSYYNGYTHAAKAAINDAEFFNYEKDYETDLQTEAADVSAKLTVLPKVNSPTLIQELLNKERPTFIQVTGLDNLYEVCRLDPTDIEELIDLYPTLAATLIQDLLYELYLKHGSKPHNHLVVVQQQAKDATTH